MNPKTPDLLSRVLAAAEKTLQRPVGTSRWLASIEQLHDEVHAAMSWPSEDGRRLVNEYTLWLMQLLRLIEREGPSPTAAFGGAGRFGVGDANEVQRATTVGLFLRDYVQADAAAALDALRVSTSEGAEQR